jgi:excisionase family DNA binding protein
MARVAVRYTEGGGDSDWRNARPGGERITARILAACSVLSAISRFYIEVSDLLFPLHVAASLSLAEVSERTGIHRDTLRKKCKAGLVPGAFQVAGGAWRLKRKILEEWWASFGEEGGARRRR